jgi:anti-sigma factor RsiW
VEPTLSHEAIRDLLGAFALDALDESEVAVVHAHLAECPRCREQVAQYRRTAALLASPGGEAPPGIWDAIASTIEAEVRPEAPTMAPVSPPGAPLRRHRARRRAALVAGAVVGVAAAVAIAVLGVQVAHLDRRLNHITATAAQQTLTAAARTALLDPASQRSELARTGTHDQPAPVVVASVVVEPSGSAYLFNQGLPGLPATSTYQLWAVSGTRAVSIALLGSRPNTVAFRVDPAVEAAVLAVTVEPAGGSVAPSGTPLATEVR